MHWKCCKLVRYTMDRSHVLYKMLIQRIHLMKVSKWDVQEKLLIILKKKVTVDRILS